MQQLTTATQPEEAPREVPEANIAAEAGSLPESVWTAARRGEEAVLFWWLESGGRVNATRGCDTALMLAARNGHVPAVELLLQRGAEVDLQGDGWTALMYAASIGHERGWSTCCCSAARRSTCRTATALPR